MRRLLAFLLLGLLGGGPLSAREAPTWTRLSVGMSGAEAVAVLGAPLLRSSARGFETWTYDDGAEVLVHSTGIVLGWTAPTSAAVPVRSRDVWSNRPRGEYYPTMYSILPRAPKVPPSGRRSS